MSLFTSMERIRNGLDGLFMFKESEKDVKRRLQRGFFTKCHFLRAWKYLEMDSMIFSCLRSLKKDVKRRLHDASLHNVDFYEPGKKLEMDSDL